MELAVNVLSGVRPMEASVDLHPSLIGPLHGLFNLWRPLLHGMPELFALELFLKQL